MAPCNLSGSLADRSPTKPQTSVVNEVHRQNLPPIRVMIDDAEERYPMPKNRQLGQPDTQAGHPSHR
jgi:hypothetical protein